MLNVIEREHYLYEEVHDRAADRGTETAGKCMKVRWWLCRQTVIVISRSPALPRLAYLDARVMYNAALNLVEGVHGGCRTVQGRLGRESGWSSGGRLGRLHGSLGGGRIC